MKLIKITTLWGLALCFIGAASSSYAREVVGFNELGGKQYISQLDITVTETCNGNVQINKIGRKSPFRRYPLFRVGDVIETVDGKKATVLVLNTINTDRTPWIEYRRGTKTEKVQISLKKRVYALPPWVQQEIRIP